MYSIERRCAEALAREAGKRIMHGRQAGFQIDKKATNDLVTDVDRAVETFIRAELRALFPNDGIFGEEYGEREGFNARQWLIDPIDGTTNFSHGIPTYCVSIALQIEGQTVAGVIYDPNLDELFSASRGDGAWLNGQPMRVSDQEVMAEAVVVTGFPPRREGQRFDEILMNLARVMRKARAVRRMGSAALDLAYVACGRMDSFWEFQLHSWDTAAGYLLVEEAGGRVTDVSGGLFTAHEPSVVASNGHLHEDLLAELAALT